MAKKTVIDSPSKEVVKGVTYRKLKPEVKSTLEKIVYQLELVGKTLQLMETRIINSEDKMQSIMNYIKHNDLEFVSTFPLNINQSNLFLCNYSNLK